jgi:hypothetical protein
MVSFIVTISCLSQGGTNPGVTPTLTSNDITRNTYLDPAQRFSHMLLESQRNSYVVISNYKVQGTPYLFGPQHSGTLYANQTNGRSASINYNTYYQQLEMFDSLNGGKPYVIKAADLDSFTYSYELDGRKDELHFISSKIIDPVSSCFFQVLHGEGRFRLYKKYFSELGIVPTNIVQSNLKQFDLNYSYYYLDTETKELKKLKARPVSIIKEFRSIRDVSPVINEDLFSSNPESYLIEVFRTLNQ